MRIVFVTNYYNHHQAAMAEAFDVMTNHGFTFIETEPLSAERKSMGWSNADAPVYVKKAYAGQRELSECQKTINDADVVIWGSCPFRMIQPRLKAKKLTFCYSERIFKKGFGPIAFGGRAVKYWLMHWRYQKNHYLLCASSFAAKDYARIGLFRNRAVKWGYFPERNVQKPLEEILAKKSPATILWAGRMISWKHPEAAISIAQRLKKNGVHFNLSLIGNGECFASIQKQVQQLKLEDCVHLYGAMSPKLVLQQMENSEVFMFTSDHNEGWGAVVNEAMSSACAVVASNAAGSVRYLIENDRNGLVYESDQPDDLYYCVESLLKDRDRCHLYGQRAFETMTNEWSAHNAVECFIGLAQELMNGQKSFYSRGPCSKA